MFSIKNSPFNLSLFLFKGSLEGNDGNKLAVFEVHMEFSLLIDHSCLSTQLSTHFLKINEQILSYNFSSLESNSLSSIQWEMSPNKKIQMLFLLFLLRRLTVDQSKFPAHLNVSVMICFHLRSENVRGEKIKGVVSYLILSRCVCHSLFCGILSRNFENIV